MADNEATVEVNYISLPESYAGPLQRDGEQDYITRYTKANKSSKDAFEIRMALPNCLKDAECTIEELDRQLQKLYGEKASLYGLVEAGIRSKSYSADASASADFFKVPEDEEFTYEAHYSEEKHLAMQANFEGLEFGAKRASTKGKVAEAKRVAVEEDRRATFENLKKVMPEAFGGMSFEDYLAKIS